MSKTTPPKPTDNGKAPEPKAVSFLTAADDDPPELAQVSRDPYEGEPWAVFVNKEGKTVQLLEPTASLTPERQLEVARQLLQWAEDQHEQGIAGVGAKRVVAADRVWRKRNPRFKLPDDAATSRDVYGRWLRGMPRVISVLCERLAEDPAASITDAERVALDTVPELARAVREADELRAQALERVRKAAEATQSDYPGGPVGPVVAVREPEEVQA